MADGEALIVFDLFPAKVRYPLTGSVDPTRAIVADGSLTIWRDGNAGPYEAWTRPVLSYEGSHASGWAVQVEDGIVLITRSARCGCGSRLKRFDPYDGRTPVQVIP